MTWIYGRPGECRSCGKPINITAMNNGLCETCGEAIFKQSI